MRKHRIAAVACLTLALTAGMVFAAEGLKSGPQVGQKVPGPFHPLNINGEGAGQKQCLYCKNGTNPVAMVFAREVNAPVTALIKKLDACTGKHSEDSMGSFVVFLSDSEGLAQELKGVAEKQQLKHTILSIDNPAGPKAYNVAQDADITVVLYTDHQVKANYSFKKGQMKDKDVEKVLADVTKILPKK